MSFPLSTIHIITLSFNPLLRSFSFMPASWLPFSIKSSNIFALFEKNVSTLSAFGNFRVFIIVLAASSSGFIIMEIPSSSLTKRIFVVYSGFLTLAIVYFAPSFFAIMHEIIFNSSASVTAIKISAVSTPASKRFS